MKTESRKKFVKRVKQQLPWIEHVINSWKAAGDLNIDNSPLRVQIKRGLCLACRGGKRLCGQPRCPLLLRLHAFLKVRNRLSADRMVGSSPPAVFVGRVGYPHVYAGPLVPPVIGDTSMYDAPEEWLGKSVGEIVDFRTNLIRGKFRVNVKKIFRNERFVEATLDLALSKGSVETALAFRKKPSGGVLMDGTLQPMGPSAMLTGMDVRSSKTDFKVEKAYRDGDLKAEDAVLDLYRDSVPVSKIQRGFSAGAFGLKKQRRMVPTRWSITAVDSMISRRIIEDQVKQRKLINEYRVYEFNHLGNRFLILLIPSTWRYEWMEAWYPSTAWNPGKQSIAMGGDWEDYYGRTTYASIGGCYYSVRLAAAEFLAEEARQAGVIAMREIYPSYIMPLGVWINRESVREAFKQGERRFDTLKEAVAYITSRLTIRIDDWISSSTLLKDALNQRRITEYL